MPSIILFSTSSRCIADELRSKVDSKARGSAGNDGRERRVEIVWRLCGYKVGGVRLMGHAVPCF